MEWAERIGRRVKLRDLHILLAVAQWGGISKAAKHLAISHPAVSKTISDLEQTLGVRLFDRGPAGVEPTTYARALLKCGATIFDELRHGLKQVEYLSDPTTGELWIGSTSALMTGFVPAVIDRLTRSNPRVAIYAHQGTVGDLHHALRERKIDLVIARTGQLPSQHDFSVEELFEESLFVVAATHSPWARRRKLNLAELIDEPWIMLPVDGPPGSLVLEAFKNAGLSMPRALVVSESGPLRNGLLATGRFLAVSARSALHFTAERLSHKVLPVRLEVDSQPVAILRLKHRTVSPVSDLFIRHAREVAKPLVKTN
jgi:DNA-binding transcriptional LysR family regulator